MAYYAGYETGISSLFLKVGYSFGNFMDFYDVCYKNISAGSTGLHEMSTVGYLPMIPVISKIFGVFLHLDPAGQIILDRWAFGVYLIYFVLCVSPLFFLIKKALIDRLAPEDRQFYGALFILFVVTSYPFIFAYERGNFVLVSLFFLTIALLHYENDPLISAISFSFFLSLKILNITFIPFLFAHYRKKHIGLVLALTCLMGLGSLLILLSSSHVPISASAVSGYFQTVAMSGLKSTFVFSDAAKVIGTSSIDGMRAALCFGFEDISQDVTLDIGWFQLACLLFGATLLAVYYLRAYRFRRLDCIEHGILLTILPLLFHPTSGDYSMVLLFPFMVLHFAEKRDDIDAYTQRTWLATCVILCFFPFQLVPWHNLPGRVVGISIRTFLIPVLYAMLLYLLFQKQSEKGGGIPAS